MRERGFGQILSRPSVFSALFVLAVVNGLTEISYRAISSYGFLNALNGTFGISVIVFVCIFAVLHTFSAELARDNEAMTTKDWMLATFVAAMISMPHPSLSWVALTVLGLRERAISSEGTLRRRSAALMLGLTIPMLWGRVVFSLFSSWILKVDATLVAVVTGSARAGNVVDLPAGHGFLWIAAPCSSFANVSLAILCWLLFVEFAGRPKTGSDYMTCAFAIWNVIVINVGRITLIARRPDLYDTLHGPAGSAAISWLTAFAVLTVCALGVKRSPIRSGEARGQALFDNASGRVPARNPASRA